MYFIVLASGPLCHCVSHLLWCVCLSSLFVYRDVTVEQLAGCAGLGMGEGAALRGAGHRGSHVRRQGKTGGGRHFPGARPSEPAFPGFGSDLDRVGNPATLPAQLLKSKIILLKWVISFHE